MVGKRVTRWNRLRTWLLVGLLLLPGTPEVLSRLYAEQAQRERALAALAPGRNVLPAPRERHQVAPPEPSGAMPPYPANHSFDAEVIVLEGEPANNTFETTGSSVGTPPTDFDFAAGTFANWTTTGSPTINSDATQGNHARLPTGAAITSTAFTIDSTAQFAYLKLKGTTLVSESATVHVLSGGGGTSTQVLNVGLISDTNWTSYRFNVVAWQGQSIQIKITRTGGTVAVDDVGTQWLEVADWVPAGEVSLVAGSPSGQAAQTGGNLTSAAFTLPDDVQNLSLRYQVAPSGSGLYVELLTGAGFGTVVALGGPLTGSVGTWYEFVAAVSTYAGQTVKIRVRPALSAVTVDDVGVLSKAVPGWTMTSTSTALAVGDDAYGSYVTHWASTGGVGLVSSEVDLGIVDVANRVDGRSFTVGYAIGDRTGSIVTVWWKVDGAADLLVYQDGANSPTGFRWGRFTILDTAAGTRGRFDVRVAGGKLYSLADNIARQQLAEPFSQQVGTGVDTSTGSFGHQETDLTVQGGPLPLVFTRYYRGHSDRFGPLGFRWSHTYDTFLGVYANGDVSVVFGSGKEEYFAWDTNSQTHKPVDVRVKSTLTRYTNPPDGVDYRYVTKDNLTYNFEGDGDLISIQDANDNTITLYRDPTTELVTAVEDPGGRTIALAYDANGRLETATGPDGAVIAYTYDGNGDLTAVDKPEDGRVEYDYSRHRLTEIRQRQGEDLPSATMVTVLTNELDEVNRVVAQTDGDGNTIEIAYLTGDDQGITRVTDVLGEDSDFYFDEWARTTFVDFPGDEAKIFIYDNVGNLEKFVDASGRETAFAYDPGADATTLTDPLGNPTNLTYNAQHLPLTITDANDHEWSFTYDIAGNVLTATDPLDHTWTYTYDSSGNKLTETTPLDRTTTYTYDSDNNLLTKTDPLDHTWSYTYDDAGHKLTETDPLDHTTTWTWNVAGRLMAMEDASGATWAYSYDLVGEIQAVLDPALEVTTWVYVGTIGQPYFKIDANAKMWSYEYDAAGRMTSTAAPLGNVTAWDYDANGRLTSKTVDPNPEGQSGHLNLVTTYDYDETGQLVAETLDPGTGSHLDRTTTFTYDDNGRLVGKQMPNGGVWTYAFDDVGNQIGVTDPLDRTTTTTYDAANRLVLVTDALSHRTKYVYDDDNRRTAVVVDPATDPDGTPYSGSHLDLTTTTVYDDADRVTSVTDPAGNVVAYGYDDAGNRTSVTVDPGSSPHLNLTTTFAYDELNRVVSTIDPLGREATVTYDSRGRKIAETRGITATEPGITTASTYDDLDHLLTVTVDPGTSPHLNNVTAYTYDDAGRQVSMTNPRGFTTAFTYDAANRLTQIEDELGGMVTLAYNAAGETTSLTNPRGKETTTTYDDLGHVLTETDPLSHTRTNVYDLAGQLTRQTDARGIETNYLYDDAGRVTNIQDENNVNLVTYGYDDAGRRTGMTDVTGSTTWTYDDASRTTSVAGPQGTLAYTYDAAGRRETMTLPSSRTIEYAYNDAGQLSDVTDWQSRTTSFTYTGFGAVETVERPNGVSSLYAYDDAGRLAAVEHDTIATMLARFAYDVDPNGNRTAVAITGTAVTNQTEDYTYDDLDRLIQVEYDDGVNPVETVAYDYDANGNRTAVTSGAQVTTYSYDDADQLTSLSGATSLSFSYDLNGNRIAAGSDTFTYDWRDRLVEAEVDSTTVTYTYSGDDLRATRQVSGSSATPYLWDRLAGLPEVVENGTVAYVQLDDPGVVAEVDASNAAVYPLADGLGSTRLRTDGSGSVTATADWDAFGTLRASSGSQGSLGWDGELRDADTGLTYLRARDYAPGTGRFLQRDSVQPSGAGSQGYNRYAFAANNPITLTDPSGQAAEPSGPVDVAGTIGMLVGATLGYARMLGTLDDMSPVARAFVTILLVFALSMLRMLMVMVLMSLGTILVGSIGGMIGTSLFLLSFFRTFMPMLEFWTACVEDLVACTDVSSYIPIRPHIESLCEAGLCDLLRRLDPRKVGVIGVCNTISGIAAAGKLLGLGIELAGTYCEVRDRSGKYGWALGGSVMIAGGAGVSSSIGYLFGIDMDSIYDVGGFSVIGDVTLAAKRGVDVNASVNPFSNSGFAFTVSGAGGGEKAVSAGVGGTYVSDQPTLRVWGFKPLVDFMADCLWGGGMVC